MLILKQRGFVFTLLFVIFFDKSKAQLRGRVIDPCYLCANNAPPRTPEKCLRLGYWSENGSYANWSPSSKYSGDCLGRDGVEYGNGVHPSSSGVTCQRLANQMAGFQFSASMPQCRSLVDRYSASCCDEVPNEDRSGSIADAEEQEWVVTLVDSSEPVAIPPTRSGVVAGTGVVNGPDPEEAIKAGIIDIDCGNDNEYEVEIFKPKPEWCCLCSECGLTAFGRGGLELFPGTTCDELSVHMIDPEFNTPLGSVNCTVLQNKYSRICCDETCGIN